MCSYYIFLIVILTRVSNVATTTAGKPHGLWYNYMNQSKSLFNISILTADICMHFTTPNMLTKPWNYLKKQIPAVGTHTWTAYIKVTNIKGDPVLVCSQNWLQALGTILYSYSFHNCRCHSWRIQWMVECQQSIPKKTSATLWLPIDTN